MYYVFIYYLNTFKTMYCIVFEHLYSTFSQHKALQKHFNSIYLSTYIAPLQGNYSEALPAQARPNRRVISS